MLTKLEARDIAHRYAIPLHSDYHALPWSTVQRVINAANDHGYRQPKNASGSRGRYFFDYLQRRAQVI